METIIKEMSKLSFALRCRSIRDFSINNKIHFVTSKNFTDKNAISIKLYVTTSKKCIANYNKKEAHCEQQ